MPKAFPKPAEHRTTEGYRLGWRPDLPDARDKLYKVTHPRIVDIPPKTSLRLKLPYVFDQDDLGSCTANAGLLCFGMLKGITSLEKAFSRLHYYYYARVLLGTVNQDSGAMIRDGIKVLASIGAIPEKIWPYDIAKFKMKPRDPGAKSLTAGYSRLATLAGQNKLVLYSRLQTRADFQSCLAKGFPFTFGFTCYAANLEDELLRKTGIMKMPDLQNDKVVGGHAVAAIGYDFNFHSNPVFLKSGLDKSQVSNEMYEVQNSWSDKWADQGRFWMPAAYVENSNLAEDFWTLRA